MKYMKAMTDSPFHKEKTPVNMNCDLKFLHSTTVWNVLCRSIMFLNAYQILYLYVREFSLKTYFYSKQYKAVWYNNMRMVQGSPGFVCVF